MKKAQTHPKGLSFTRYYTTAGTSPFAQFRYETRSSSIKKPTGEVVAELTKVEVPEGWSQIATDILAQKYFRKTGLPESISPSGTETSIKQVVHRLANCWKVWGQRYGYFASDRDAEVFYDETAYALLAQFAAPNSPQWFNTGLFESYGISGSGQGHFFADPKTGELRKSASAYERPQTSACFILSVEDDLVNPGGIMDLLQREARVFKYGSGSGTNFSAIRGANEKLSSGGYSSGLMSFLKVADRAAGAIKSGGTTRRAAKMVCLDIDHPEIEAFITWKQEEEKKVAALAAAGYSAEYEGEAYQTVSGQNSNNSVRIPNRFFEALEKGENWSLTARSTAETVQQLPAQKLWNQLTQAAWACADPGVQFDTTINEWHTCPADGRIRASNPCSEYMFLDNTACNLASLNLRKFYNAQTQQFDVEGFTHMCRLWTVVLEISVLMAQFPSEEVALRSWQYRTVGLGYANLGSLLMVAGLPYHSEQARTLAAAITAIMTGAAYRTSAELAQHLCAFNRYRANREHMLRVIRNHRYAAHNTPELYEDLSLKPQGLNPQHCPHYLLDAACQLWDEALHLGEQFGFRNAQVSVLAPTGTIGLLMDCDTTGVEPEFALVKMKKLSGGGYFKIINQAVPEALKQLGYTEKEMAAIVQYAKGSGTLTGAPHLNPAALQKLGFTTSEIAHFEQAAPSAFDISSVFSVYALEPDFAQRLGLSATEVQNAGFSVLAALGLSAAQLAEANLYVCGTQTVEGAPFLRPEHLPVFDCANRCGNLGTRFIQPEGHLLMMAAVQPFLSGAISKTVNLPNETPVTEIGRIYRRAWELGLKACALYRDGCKQSQPLSSGNKQEQKPEEPAALLTEQQVLQAALELINSSPDTRFKRELSNVVMRKRLPEKRNGFTQKAKIDGHTVYIRTGEYEDGSLGEIFIDMYKEGASFRSLLNCFAISVSLGLQYGVPLEEFVSRFTFTRFEPAGQVEHPNIKQSTSILDYLFRLLAFEYLQRTDLVHVPPTPMNAAGLVTPEHLPSATAGSAQKPASVSDFTTANQPKMANTLAAGTFSISVENTQRVMATMMGDAPLCNVCGHLTIRSGTCYKCLNCGNSLGCS